MKSSNANASAARKRTADLLIPISLFAWGVLLNLAYAGKGFMPLEQSIIFDGGWRVMSGQIPFRDFSTFTGVAPLVIQAVFFKALGVTWLAYCVHAAVFNGLYCILVYSLLRILGGSRPLSFGYGALSAVSFYAVPGTPYMEYHGFFFVLLAVLLFAYSRTASPTQGRLCWLGAALAVLLSLLSKQNVPAASAGVLLAAAAYGLEKGWRPPLVKSVIVMGGALAVAALALLTAGVSLDRIWSDFVIQTADTGLSRLGVIRDRILGIEPAGDGYHYGTFEAILTIAAGALVFARRRATRAATRQELLLLAMAAGMMVAAFLFRVTTNNQDEGAHQYSFALIGILHLCVTSSRLQGAEPLWRNLSWMGSTLCVAVALLHTQAFWLCIVQRCHHGIQFSDDLATRPQLPGLQFMHLQTRFAHSAENLDKTIELLRSREGSFFLLGDSSILYGLAGKPSVNPQLYFHTGMARTPFQRHRLREYEEELLANFRRYGVDAVVLEGRRTWTDIRLEMLPQVQRLVEESGGPAWSYGRFEIHEIQAGPGLSENGREDAPSPTIPAYTASSGYTAGEGVRTLGERETSEDTD